jgi:hypothetical protein
MSDRPGPGAPDSQGYGRLLRTPGTVCPYADSVQVHQEELRRHCPFIGPWTRKLSYCLLHLGWCRVLHPAGVELPEPTFPHELLPHWTPPRHTGSPLLPGASSTAVGGAAPEPRRQMTHSRPHAKQRAMP